MMKIIGQLFKSKEFRIGLGLGLILASIALWNKTSLTQEDIEIRARELGMKYKWELKAGEVD